MVHETGRRAELLTVDHVDTVIVAEKVQAEEVGRAVLAACSVFAQICDTFRDHLAKIEVDKLAGDDPVGRAKTCQVKLAPGFSHRNRIRARFLLTESSVTRVEDLETNRAAALNDSIPTTRITSA